MGYAWVGHVSGSHPGLIRRSVVLEPSSNCFFRFSHLLSSMPPALNRSNSHRFVTPRGDEVTRPHRGVLTIDSLGMPYLSGQEVRFFDRVVDC